MPPVTLMTKLTAGKDRRFLHADCVSGSTGPTFLENVHADRQGCKLRALASAVGMETTSIVAQRLARPSTALGRSPQPKDFAPPARETGNQGRFL